MDKKQKRKRRRKVIDYCSEAESCSQPSSDSHREAESSYGEDNIPSSSSYEIYSETLRKNLNYRASGEKEGTYFSNTQIIQRKARHEQTKVTLNNNEIHTDLPNTKHNGDNEINTAHVNLHSQIDSQILENVFVQNKEKQNEIATTLSPSINANHVIAIYDKDTNVTFTKLNSNTNKNERSKGENSDSYCTSNNSDSDLDQTNESNGSEENPDGRNNVQTDPLQIKVYISRFWILTIFSLTALLQTVIWGTFGPIMDSAESAFGWEDYMIAIFQSLGPLSVIIFMIPIAWFNQTYGLRYGMMLAISLMTVGTGIRCITSADKAFTALAFMGATLNGLSGGFVLSLPPMVAATWFPPNERITATAIGALSAQLGGVGMYLSPLIVRSPSDDVSPDDIKQDIMTLMYIEFGIILSIFLCILVYFPDKPEHPPSLSSGMERERYVPSIKKLMRNKPFLGVVVTMMFSFGIPVVWISVMNFELSCIGVDQKQSMWIGISACILSGAAAFIFARITDHIYGHMKVFIICLLLSSSCCFLWFLLLLKEIIPTSTVQIYIAVSGGVALQYASVPLLIEFAVELAYPCSENVVGAMLTGMFSLVAAIFLLLFIIPTECYYWAVYVLVACTLLTTVPLLFVKETHKRSALDRE